jgi:succinate dehydrogenase / fumarate reductase cytochrome b subunit
LVFSAANPDPGIKAINAPRRIDVRLQYENFALRGRRQAEGEKLIMATTGQRPLSPHLTIWRWGPHMLVSILHRITGDGLAIVGAMGLVWWLFAAATGPEAYAAFLGHATSWYGHVVMIGLTWAFFEHMFSGLRHFVLDTGAGYELRTNRMWAMIIPVAAIIVTAAIWTAICTRSI